MPGLGRAERLEQLALLGRELARRLHFDPHDQIAAPAPLEDGHPRAAQPQLAARLGAGGDAQLMLLAVEPGQHDRAAERRRGEADRRARVERGALTLEDRVARDVQEDVEVARRRAAHPGLALPAQPHAGAFVHPRWDVDGERLGLVDPSLAPAAGAGIGDHLARAVAAGAGALDDEEALLRAHLAHAAAGAAGARGRARPRAGAAADVATHRDIDGDLGRFAVERVFQADFHVIAQIGAALRRWAAATAAPAHEFAEDILEDIAERAEIARPRRAAMAVLERGMAEAIVGGPLLRVLQAVIGFVDRLEPRLGLGIAGVAIGVPAHRELAIGALDRAIVRAAFAFEKFVIIDFGGHFIVPPPRRDARGIEPERPTPAAVARGSFPSKKRARLRTGAYALPSSTSENSASTTSSAGASGAAAPGLAWACCSFS